ncbi:DUF2971 domain-containing protein [Pantoea ananatis]|uniref:DUF2971 domain-containing protein n=1 Tax=Pantoea ananas TaxID=553 RepID=UPI001F0CB4B4|nr:DUF2971 domain-containing protein [Pantoea ananatis]
MNDEVEVRHGITAFTSALNYLQDDLDQYLIDVLRQSMDEFSKLSEKNSYNISFCQNPDLLSQWRGYASTQGVCLEFDSKELEDSLDFDGATFISNNVFYTKPDSTLEAKDEILRFLKNIDRRKYIPNLFHDWVVASSLLKSLIPFFKHISFKEESEYRIVVQPEFENTKVKFRLNNHGLIPYLDIKAKENNAHCGRLPLKSVRIGPCKNRDFVAEGIKSFLLCHDYKDTKYSFTDATFRV